MERKGRASVVAQRCDNFGVMWRSVGVDVGGLSVQLRLRCADRQASMCSADSRIDEGVG